MAQRVLILGAGFGGLEIATMLSEGSGGEIEVTLIDKGEGFSFGFSKLELMFGRATAEEVRMPYAQLDKPGLRFVRETITAIDPEARRVTTDGGSYEADAIVIALGADYDFAATPGLTEAGNEFYSFAGAERLGEILPTFAEGRVVIGVCGAPFKCPPAPSECALLLDDDLRARGVREQCEISFVIPFGKPVPPSPETSAALEAEFAERGIELIPGRRVAALDGERAVVVLDDGAELSFDLFLGVPKHRAPDVVIDSGIAEDGFVPVDPATLRTRFEGVYAVGDVATAGVPKAGVFAEGAGRIVAQSLLAEFAGAEPPGRHLGQGTCYIEFGHGRVASVDIDFLSGPEKTGTFNPPSAAQVAEKAAFGSTRRKRWFGA
ncbi:MAG TPA: FAD-dependent oxidoreductase [Solirubrobacterales bacterium]|nr:FAD-dependent oxidoreductase [Solirubrobacterales bacterium]